MRNLFNLSPFSVMNAAGGKFLVFSCGFEGHLPAVRQQCCRSYSSCRATVVASFQFVMLKYCFRCFSWFPLWPGDLRVLWKTASNTIDGFALNISIFFQHYGCTDRAPSHHSRTSNHSPLHHRASQRDKQASTLEFTESWSSQSRRWTVGRNSEYLAGSQGRRHREREKIQTF